MLRNASEWLDMMGRNDAALDGRFREIYGDDARLLSGRRDAYARLIGEFMEVYGDRPIMVVRSPARINLLGVHVDHRGGHVNYMCISREIVMAAEPRQDDGVTMCNTDPAFEPRAFRIGSLLPPEQRGDWFTYIEEATIQPGDWENYIRAPLLRLQDRFKDRPLRGMNLAVTGDIPGTGLSSSSALVIATLEAALRVNGLDLSNEDKVPIAGEGEWYVGTRGGWGDHSAMLYGKRNRIAHVGFFPLTVKMVSFFPDYKVMVCNSFKEAKKSADARNTYNTTIATYNAAFMLIKNRLPEYADRLVHLRDVNTENLGWTSDQIYQLLKALPERITRGELLEGLPADREELETMFRTHDEPEGGYTVRQTCLFGLAECERGKICIDYLERGDVLGFGRLKYIAHDGDRVVTFTPDGRKIPWDNRVTDAYLDRLISDLRSGDPERQEAAQLPLQHGGYGCSIEELDQLVDIAKQVEGVAGAGLTGAGLGGCVLVFVKEESAQDVVDAVNEQYYGPKGFPLGTEICTSVEGAGVVL